MSSFSSLISPTKKSFTIVIGNKSYSSWSLRGWLALRTAVGSKEEFNEIVCPLVGAFGTNGNVNNDSKSRILSYSPTGKVPALIDHDLDNIVVYDSLAIALHIADRFPLTKLIPSNPKAKALCFSASAEMHSSFTGLRTNLPMNCVSTGIRHGIKALALPDVQSDINRLNELWNDLILKYGSLAEGEDAGPFLFGRISIADIMFAPVALRFKTYDPLFNSLNEISKQYVQALIDLPAIQEWISDARLEPKEMKIDAYEAFAD
eukprot:gene22779-29494_t